MTVPIYEEDGPEMDRFNNEAMLLGSILAYGHPALFHSARAICDPSHFRDVLNAKIFALTERGFNEGLKAFKLSHWVISQLRDDETLKALEVSGSSIIAKYIAMAAPAIGVEGCARQLKYDWLNDKLSDAVNSGETEEAEKCAAEMQVLSKAHLTREENLLGISTSSDGTLSRLSDAFSKGVVPIDFAHAGSVTLSSAIGGWRRGRMYILAGRPGMGKSTLATSWLIRTAGRGHGVMLFSLEMTMSEISEMILCDLAWSSTDRIEYRDVASTRIDKPDFERHFNRLYEAKQKLNQVPFMISDRGGMTIAEIRSKAMQYAQRLETDGKRLEVICIDHLNLIKGSDRYSGNKVAETEETSAALKALAKELNCAVVCLCQLNRGVEGREDKRPTLSDLRWSGGIEQDADVVMFAYREAYYLERKHYDDAGDEQERLNKLLSAEHRIEVQIAKHRGGPCRIMEFYCDMGCAVVRDLEKNYV